MMFTIGEYIKMFASVIRMMFAIGECHKNDVCYRGVSSE